MTGRVLVVVPALDERVHIEGLIESLAAFATRAGALVVVADGGSRDGTRRLVEKAARRHSFLRLLDNTARIQSAGINRAVARFGRGRDWLIRIDAHAAYPDGYCETLLAEAGRTGADSVVVGMVAEGRTPLQRAIAAAQNSRLGNGGSPHRRAPEGAWVEHGHHALMRLAAFRAVGGYDEGFRHNEDAELDHRLLGAGCRIWLTSRAVVTYYPRERLGALARQYLNHGAGRARNLRKHRAAPRPRQAAVLSVAPALALAGLAPLWPGFAAPGSLWLAACAAGGGALAWRARDPRLALAGAAAAVMHAAWSAGFWRGLLTGPHEPPPTEART